MTSDPSTKTAPVRSEPIDPDEVRNKFVALGDALDDELYERTEQINVALAALVARAHLFLLGPPGVAKTYLFERLMARVGGARFFKALLFKTLPPDKLFGPPSIPDLKEGREVTVIAGKLPWADVSLLDECFKASPSSLLALNRILNERQFENWDPAVGEPRMNKVPLSSAFLASNELPAGDEENDLSSMYDRIDLRMVVNAPADAASWRAIARMRPDENPPVILTWDEVLVAQAEARALPITDGLFDAFDAIRSKLRTLGIDVSPRRYGRLQYLCAAVAWLAGADEVRAEHAEILCHMLWDDPAQSRDVERSVLEVVAPGQRAALLISDKVAELVDELTECLSLPPEQRVAQANELFDRARTTRAELDEALPQHSGRARRTLEDAAVTLTAAHSRLLSEAYGVKVEELGGLR